MRCKICNKVLSLGEAISKDRWTDEFKDTCYRCNSDIYATLSEFEWDLKDIPLDKEVDKGDEVL